MTQDTNHLYGLYLAKASKRMCACGNPIHPLTERNFDKIKAIYGTPRALGWGKVCVGCFLKSLKGALEEED